MQIKGCQYIHIDTTQDFENYKSMGIIFPEYRIRGINNYLKREDSVSARIDDGEVIGIASGKHFYATPDGRDIYGYREYLPPFHSSILFDLMEVLS